jgi:5-oxoprolinase (ATP-hydrolysing) subunit A
MVRDGKVRAIDGSDIALEVDTICVHGDGPHAAEFAERLRIGFEDAGITIAAVGR